jgi:hypothetical protein
MTATGGLTGAASTHARRGIQLGLIERGATGARQGHRKS